MIDRERQLERIREIIERQIDKLKYNPTVGQIRTLSHYENMIRGRREFDEIFRSIHAITSLINYPPTEGTPFKDVVVKEVIYGRRLTINKFLKPFVTISVYRKHFNYSCGIFDNFERSDFDPYYVKSFNPENGEIEVTPNKEDVACFYSKDLIDTFHKTLVQEEKYKISTIYGHEVINGRNYSKTTRIGEWAISELHKYGEDGIETSSMWYYPNKYYSEGFIPYNEERHR